MPVKEKISRYFKYCFGEVPFLATIGALVGIASHFNFLAQSNRFLDLTSPFQWIHLFCAILYSIFAVAGIRGATSFFIRNSGWSFSKQELFMKRDTKTYGLLLLVFVGALGFPVSFFVKAGILNLFFLAKVGVYLSVSLADDETFPEKNILIFALFFFSGFAALIYQIVWQRVLFTVFGINMQSVTMIVSLFMLGLGGGALLGGVFTKKFPGLLMEIFFVSELLIGLFGLIGIQLMQFVGDHIIHLPSFISAMALYLLLCIPTTLMGMNLPLFIGQWKTNFQKTDDLVGALYFINTIGSAFAAFITVKLLFFYFGLQSTAFLAAAVNVLIGGIGFSLLKIPKP